LVGLYLAARDRLVHLLRERAERAEREQVLLAAQARAAERSRLAAEIHDLVAHRVTLVVLRAGALQVNAPDEATREAADELREHGCRALDELRELVGVLRRDGTPTAALDERPAPALAELAEEAVQAGQPVRLVEEGDSSRLSPVVGRTAYRVVQEALTNARKHAWGAQTLVRVEYGHDQVRIAAHTTAARLPGAGPLPRTGSGTGLTGLRERVELIGGSLDAGPAAGGGFRVETVLPARTAP
jgi:signal transduction histidine kinase